MNSRLLAIAIVLVHVGCAAGRPDRFLLADNELAYDRAEQLVRDGEGMIADGKRRIADGKDLRDQGERMIEEGRELRAQGKEMAARGRKGLEAALTLEEAERLRQQGESLRLEAIPPEGAD